jgi:predicted transcriptional regulator
MARKKSQHLTDVVESLAQASKGPPAAYSTVLTMLRILEKKGHVRHTKRGRAFVYQSVYVCQKAQESAIRYLRRRFFKDSPELLVLSLIELKQIGATQLERPRERIGGKK